MSLEDFFFTEHPALIKYECVSITHPNFSQDFNLVRNAPFGLKVEADPPENYIEFTYVPMEVKTLGSGHDMDQSMEFTIGDVGELLPAEIERISEANGFQTKPVITYREYASNSTSMVATDQQTDWIFDGTDDYITFGDVVDFDQFEPYTVSLWLETTDTDARIIGKRDGGEAAPGWAVTLNGGNVKFVHINNSISDLIDVQSNITVNDGVLRHIVFAYDGSGNAAGVSLQINGVSAATTTNSDTLTGTTVNSVTLTVGSISASSGTSVNLSGIVKHIAVWDQELTSTEMTDAYGGGTPPADLATAVGVAPLFWIKMDEDDATGSGGIIDYGTGGSNGTAQGGLAPTFTGGTNALVHTGPVFGPFTLEINSIAFNKTGCTFTAKATAFNRARTGEVYDAARFPMLRAFV